MLAITDEQSNIPSLSEISANTIANGENAEGLGMCLSVCFENPDLCSSSLATIHNYLINNANWIRNKELSKIPQNIRPYIKKFDFSSFQYLWKAAKKRTEIMGYLNLLQGVILDLFKHENISLETIFITTYCYHFGKIDIEKTLLNALANKIKSNSDLFLKIEFLVSSYCASLGRLQKIWKQLKFNGDPVPLLASAFIGTITSGDVKSHQYIWQLASSLDCEISILKWRDYAVFQVACTKGNLPLIEFLWSMAEKLGCQKIMFSGNKNQYLPFNLALQSDQLDTAKFLWDKAFLADKYIMLFFFNILKSRNTRSSKWLPKIVWLREICLGYVKERNIGMITTDNIFNISSLLIDINCLLCLEEFEVDPKLNVYALVANQKRILSYFINELNFCNSMENLYYLFLQLESNQKNFLRLTLRKEVKHYTDTIFYKLALVAFAKRIQEIEPLDLDDMARIKIILDKLEHYKLLNAETHITELNKQALEYIKLEINEQESSTLLMELFNKIVFGPIKHLFCVTTKNSSEDNIPLDYLNMLLLLCTKAKELNVAHSAKEKLLTTLYELLHTGKSPHDISLEKMITLLEERKFLLLANTSLRLVFNTQKDIELVENLTHTELLNQWQAKNSMQEFNIFESILFDHSYLFWSQKKLKNVIHESIIKKALKGNIDSSSMEEEGKIRKAWLQDLAEKTRDNDDLGRVHGTLFLLPTNRTLIRSQSYNSFFSKPKRQQHKLQHLLLPSTNSDLEDECGTSSSP